MNPNSPTVTDESNFHPTFLYELARKYEGKLLTRKEITLNNDVFTSLLTSACFTPTLSIQKTFFSVVCQRCNNSKYSLFASIPCTRCKKAHYYCRNCLTMGRVMECEPLYYWSGKPYLWPKWKDPCSWQGELTTAQRKAAERIKKVVHEGGELLVWAVTGAGKTEMLFPGITIALKQGKRICIATPRADVVRELLPRLQQAFTRLHIQGLYSGSRDNDGTAQLIIATTHQLLRYQEAFDVLIIDEIDAFPYHQDSSLQFAAARAAKKISSLIYLTATPRQEQQSRMIKKQLAHVFVPARFHGHPLPVPKLYKSKPIQVNAENVLLPRSFINWIEKRSISSRQLLLFVPTIFLAKHLQSSISELLLANKIILQQNLVKNVFAEDELRKEKIQQFRNKQIYALITTTILERGVTFPSVDVAVLQADHAIFDEAALVQIAGRAGRSPIDPQGEVVFFYSGKTNAIVRAQKAIKQMNQRAKLQQKEEGGIG